MHTDPTNAARVRPEQTDAKTLTRSQNEYESITFEQSCEQVPNEAAVEAELEEHASLQHGHGHACRKPPRWPPRRPQHRPARPGGGPSVGTGPPEVRGAAGAAQVDVVYAFTDSMCLLEQLTCRSTKAEALYGERVTSQYWCAAAPPSTPRTRPRVRSCPGDLPGGAPEENFGLYNAFLDKKTHTQKT